MPRFEFDLKGRKKSHPPLKIVVLPLNDRGEVELQFSQEAEAAFLTLDAHGWARVIVAIEHNLERKR